jgi:hypothetical protein
MLNWSPIPEQPRATTCFASALDCRPRPPRLPFLLRRGAPPVRTQLCLALAAVAVHVPSARWAVAAGAAGAAAGASGCVVRWFAARFSQLPPDVALPCMLELLTVLPQVRTDAVLACRGRLLGPGYSCASFAAQST